MQIVHPLKDKVKKGPGRPRKYHGVIDRKNANKERYQKKKMSEEKIKETNALYVLLLLWNQKEMHSLKKMILAKATELLSKKEYMQQLQEIKERKEREYEEKKEKQTLIKDGMMLATFDPSSQALLRASSEGEILSNSLLKDEYEFYCREKAAEQQWLSIFQEQNRMNAMDRSHTNYKRPRGRPPLNKKNEQAWSISPKVGNISASPFSSQQLVRPLSTHVIQAPYMLESPHPGQLSASISSATPSTASILPSSLASLTPISTFALSKDYNESSYKGIGGKMPGSMGTLATGATDADMFHRLGSNVLTNKDIDRANKIINTNIDQCAIAAATQAIKKRQLEQKKQKEELSGSGLADDTDFWEGGEVKGYTAAVFRNDMKDRSNMESRIGDITERPSKRSKSEDRYGTADNSDHQNSIQWSAANLLRRAELDNKSLDEIFNLTT